VILGSDILKFTPANIMAHTYCLDENQWNQVIAPVKPSTYIGPYTDCNRMIEDRSTHHDVYRQYQQLQPTLYFPQH
jgi:hypothetical protein